MYYRLLPWIALLGAMCADVLGFLALIDVGEWCESTTALSTPAVWLVAGLGMALIEGMFERIRQTSSPFVFLLSVAVMFVVLIAPTPMMLVALTVTAVGNMYYNKTIPITPYNAFEESAAAPELRQVEPRIKRSGGVK
jgi:hypothetical protein